MHANDFILRLPAVAALVTAAAISWASVASANHLATPSGSSATSGRTPTNKTLSKSYSANETIYAVTIGEDSDEPCYMQIKYRDANTSATQNSLTFNECDGHKVGDMQTASLPAGTYVTGVRICLNSDRNRMKGIQLIGGYGDCVLGAESTTVSTPDCSRVVKVSGLDYRTCTPGGPSYRTMSCSIPLTDWVERPNCPGSKYDIPDNTWEKVVSCPDKMVATGMKLRTINGDGDRLGIDGIALECHTLEDN
jgi:hypothetical protein